MDHDDNYSVTLSDFESYTVFYSSLLSRQPEYQAPNQSFVL